METTNDRLLRESTPPPSVLFISRAYPPTKGGMEQLSYDLTTSIAARTRTHIIANRRGKLFLPLFFPVALFRALMRLPRYEILHIGDPVLSILAWILRSWYRRPTAITIHGLDIVFHSRLYQWYLRRFLRSADVYICISRYVETILHDRFGFTKTLVIPPGIRDIFYRPEQSREALKHVVGRDLGNRPVLLTVGRLVERKGVAWFLEKVFPHISQDAFYIIAGEGPNRTRAEACARHANISDRVLFVGAVNDETRCVLYNAADLVIMPNILVKNDAEGFGIVALEAASCGVTVVASALQGIVDAVYDGRNGVLVEAGNATAYIARIQYLLDHPEERVQFGISARTFTLAHFSWTVIAQRYLDAFSHLRRV